MKLGSTLNDYLLSIANLLLPCSPADFVAGFHNGSLERGLFSKKGDEKSEQGVDAPLRQAHSAAELESLIGLKEKVVVVLFYGGHCGYATHGRGALYEFHSAAKYFINRDSLVFVV